jgi:hypothetical protein
MEEEIKKLQQQVLELKTDMVYMLYIIERIDKNTFRAPQPPQEPPFPTEGMHVEKF